MLIADILSGVVQIASSNGATASSVFAPSPEGPIEYSISLGNLLTMASFLVFVTVYVVNSRGAAKVLAARLQTVDLTLEDFKHEMRKLAEVIIAQTKQDGRIALIEQRLLQEGQRVDELGRNLGTFKNLVLEEKIRS